MKLNLKAVALYMGFFIIVSFIMSGCNNDDEPSIPSSTHIANDLQELMNKLPMDWGLSISQTKEAMEALNLSDFNQVSAASSSIMYENEQKSMYIVYGFEKSKLYSVLIVFPRNEDLDYNKIFSQYLYLGCVTEEVYADSANNRLISIHPSHTYDDTNYAWSAIGFTMIDDM